MKCDFCPFAPSAGEYGQEECPILWSEHGTVWKDERVGCKLSYSHLKKMERQRDEDYLWMGTVMGLEHDFEIHGLSMEKAIDHAKHMIGIDGLSHKPYTRHGRKFYKPFRNHWAGFDAELDMMSKDAFGLTEKHEPKYMGGMPLYYLTRRGLDWLGNQIGVTIHDKEG